MKHLLSFIVICSFRLVAGLPRLNDVEDNSKSILEKHDLISSITARASDELNMKLQAKVNPKDGGKSGNHAATMQSPSPVAPTLPKLGSKTAVGSQIQRKQKVDSQSLGSQQPGVKHQPKTSPELSKLQSQGNPKQGGMNSAEIVPKKQSILKPDFVDKKTNSKFRSATQQNYNGKRQPTGNPKAGSGLKQQTGLSVHPKTQKLPTGVQKGPAEQASRKGLSSDRGSSGSTASRTNGNAHGGSIQSKAPSLNTKGQNKDKSVQQNGKRAGPTLNKASSQRRRICRRADGDKSCTWDIEEGGGGLESQNSPSSPSKPDTAPSVITQMSRAGREYARANPWTTGAFALSATSSVFGNAAGLTDQCCDENCAKFTAHALNYCGIGAGIGAAAMAFTSHALGHQSQKKKEAEDKKQVENLKMKTEGHDAAIEEHGQKIEQTNKKFSGELARTKQTLNQVSKRVGVAKLLEDTV